MFLDAFSFLIPLILTTALTVESINRTHVGHFVAANAICPSDPFSNLQAHATPKPSDPVCCLIPPSSEDLTLTDEFLSFEDWKSKQRELEAHSAQTQSANQTIIHTDTSVSKASDGTLLPTASLSVDAEPAADITFTHPPYFHVPLTDRFNYASLDCSARIRSSHSSARSPSSLLSSKKDKYMLSPCSAQPNYVVVELCDDIRIDTVQLANFEYFSGVFRDFKVSVAQTYTADDQAWVEAGLYRAKNIRGVQSFHPLADLRPFYRYVRIDFLSHYGNEFYCPVSLLRVYGLTQLEEWKWELWQSALEPETSPSGNQLTSMIAQHPEPHIVSVANTSGLLTQPPSSDTSTEAEDTLFSTLSTKPLTDVYVTSQTSTSSASAVSTPSTVSVIPFTETLSIPTSSSDSFASPSTHPSQVTNTNLTSLSPTASFISVFGHGSPGESIFRTIMNRLNVLEANTTLYNKYVEEQTMRLRDALRKLEEDVGRLEGLNKNQQQVFIRTVQEFDRHRHQTETERSALSERINRLTNEILLEKKLGIAQLCLLLTVIVFMALTRGSQTKVSALFGGTSNRYRSRSHASDSVAKSRSKTPMSHKVQKKGRLRSHSTTTVVSTSRSKSRKDTHAISPYSNSSSFFADVRPTYRLHRSNSSATSAITPFTGKRLAQTAHLHEIPVLKRFTLNFSEGRKTPTGALRARINSSDMHGSCASDFDKQNKGDKASDSWIDTEPGSGTSDNDGLP